MEKTGIDGSKVSENLAGIVTVPGKLATTLYQECQHPIHWGPRDFHGIHHRARHATNLCLGVDNPTPGDRLKELRGRYHSK